MPHAPPVKRPNHGVKEDQSRSRYHLTMWELVAEVAGVTPSSRTQLSLIPSISLGAVAMSSEAIPDLSILDLLHVLNERLGLDAPACGILRYHPRCYLPVEAEASQSRSTHLDRPVYTVRFPQIASLGTRAHDVLRSGTSLRNLSRPVNRLPLESRP